MKLLDYIKALDERRDFVFFRDFASFATGTDGLTSLAADSGSSVAITAGGRSGLLALTTGATDNNEAAVYSTNEVFKMSAGLEMVFEARLTFAEANTDDANVAAGFASAVGANLLLDDGAGPKTNYSGAMIFKTDGSNVWKAHSSKGTTQTSTTGIIPAGGANAQVLRITIDFSPPTTALVKFEVDVGGGLQLFKDSLGRVIQPHAIDIASVVAMSPFVYVKAGGANSEVVSVDYMIAAQLR